MKNFFDLFFESIGEDKNRVGLLNTPKRVIESWNRLYSGYKMDSNELFANAFCDENYKDLILLKNIEFYSMCEHHLLPFFGKISIGYIPNGKLIGVSKLIDLVEIFSKRLQIQERLTKQIADSIDLNLAPKGVMVLVEATHLCALMQNREKSNATFVTNEKRGILNEKESRAEFFHLLNREENHSK